MIKITDELKARVQDHEGLRTSMYLDSLGKATVGIGHLVQAHERERFAEGVEIPMDEIMEIFEMDLNRAAAGADLLISECIGHDLPRRAANEKRGQRRRPDLRRAAPISAVARRAA